MSTYIPQVTDNIPQPYISPVDFSFLSGSLQAKDSQYEQGLRKVSSMYRSVVQAPITNADNMKVRDQYIKTAESQLSELAGTDLSLPKNQAVAEKVFAPFYEDDELIADQAATKKMNAAIQKGYSYLDSTKEEDRSKFWREGIEYVQQGLIDLQNAKRGDGSILKSAQNARSYIPNYDIMGHLRKAAGEKGISIEDVQITPEGYIVKTKNGNGTKIVFEDWVRNELVMNPQAMDALRVRASVDYQREINSYVKSGFNEVQARDIIARNYIDAQRKQYNNELTNYENSLTELKAKSAGTERLLKDKYGNTAPTDPSDIKSLADKQQQDLLIEEYNKKIKEYKTLIADYSNPTSEKYKADYDKMLAHREDYLAHSYLSQIIPAAAFNLRVEGGIKQDVELSPIRKMELELQKEQVKNSYNSTSQSGSSASKIKPEDVTMKPGGVTMLSKDPMDVTQRMETMTAERRNAYLQNAGKLLSVFDSDYNFGLGDDNKVRISTKLINELTSAISTGSYSASVTPDSDIYREVMNLRDKNVIKKTSDLRTPSSVLSDLIEYAQNFYTAQKDNMSGDVVGLLKSLDDNTKEYTKLKEINENVNNKLTRVLYNDPQAREFFTGDKFLTREEYINNNIGKFIQQDKKSQITGYTADGIPIYNQAPSSSATSGNYRPEQVLGKRWDDFNKKYNEALKPVYKDYLNYEGAFVGRDVILKGSTASNIADVIFSDSRQIEGGFAPINQDILLDNGADKTSIDKLIGVIMANKSTVKEMTATKIGSTGEMSVRVRPQDLRKVLSQDELKGMSGTLDAINKYGLEFTLPAGSGLDSDLSSVLLEEKLMNDYSEINAPEYIKSMGADYTIKRNNDGYLVYMTVPVFNNGVKESKTQRLNIPLTSTITEVSNQAVNSIMQQIQTNKDLEARYKQSSNINFGRY